MAVALSIILLVARIDLGRHLFYDVRLSGNGKQSCASCHRQESAFTDGRARAVGSTGELHPRSAMSLVNLTRARLLTWTNPHPQRLEEQALIPLLGRQPIEMGADVESFLVRAQADSVYRRLFAAAWLPYSSDTITHALAAFERTIVSNRAPYDRYHFDREDRAISEAAKRGEILFFSEPLSCFRCHGGTNFSDSAELKDNGLLREGGRFKAPTLRNVALTAPYMHDGRLPTLDAVIEHYVKGGQHTPYQDKLIRGFSLSERDRRDLTEFLESLTDRDLLTDPRYSNPWCGERAAPRGDNCH